MIWLQLRKEGLNDNENDNDNYYFDVKVERCGFMGFVIDVIDCGCLGCVFCSRIKRKTNFISTFIL